MTPAIRLPWSSACALILILAGAIASAAPAPSTHDGFNASFNNAVRALEVQSDGKIVAGGVFTAMNDASTRFIARLNPDGTLDDSFNHGGPNSSVNAICRQNDGKLLVGGAFQKYDTTTSLYVARLNLNGSLDHTFHSDLATTSGGGVKAMVLQPGGALVVLGKFGNIGSSVARLASDGSIDTSFQFSLPSSQVWLSVIAEQRDRKILVGGSTYESGSNLSRPCIMRLNPEGSVDHTFSEFTVSAGPGKWLTGGVIKKMIVQPDDKILVCYSLTLDDYYNEPTETITYFRRLNPDGTPDTEFPVCEDYNLLFQQPDGKIYTQHAVNTYEFVRWNKDGSPDPTLISSPGYSYVTGGCAIQPDGKLLIATINSMYDDIRILRLYQNGSIDSDFNPEMNCDDCILAIAIQPDQKPLICGEFNNINGISRRHVARLNVDGSLDRSFDPGSGTMTEDVQEIDLLSDGKILISGFFHYYNGASRYCCAKLNPDGSLDESFNPDLADVFGGECHFAEMPDGKFMIYGRFREIEGVARNGVARLNRDGSLDRSFDAGSACEYRLLGSMCLLPDGKAMLGGGFTSFNGVARKNIVRLTGSGAVDTSFDSPYGSYPYLMALDKNGKLLVTSARQDGTNDIGLLSRLNVDGSFDSDFTTFTTYATYFHPGILKMHCLRDGKILVARLDSRSGSSVARLNADGTLDSSFYGGTGANGWIYDLQERDDGKILVAGGFTEILGEARSHIALLNVDGTLDKSSSFLSTGPDGEVNALATSCDDSILIGGSMASLNGNACKGLARLNTEGWLDTSFTTQARQVDVIAALPGGKSYICDTPSTGSLRLLTRRNSDGTTDTAFKPVAIDGRVYSMLTPPQGGIIVGGDFHSVGGVNRHQIAHIDDIGSVTLSFNCGDAMDLGPLHYIESDNDDNPDELIVEHRGRINSIVSQAGKLIVGGLFDRVARVERRCVARLLSNGVLDTSFNAGAGPDGEVWSVLVQLDGKVLIAGDFVHVGGVPRHGIARLEPDGALDPTFVPESAEYNYFNSMALQADGKIIVGGFYDSGDVYGRVARLNPDGSLDCILEPQEPMQFHFAGVNGLALQSDGKLLVGGLFNTFGAFARHNLARISNPDASIDRLEVSPGGTAVTWRIGGSHPQPYAVFFEDSNDGNEWRELGWGTSIPGVGFRIGQLDVPVDSNHFVRATGWTTTGLSNGSVSIHRSTLWFVATSYNATLNWACYN